MKIETEDKLIDIDLIEKNAKLGEMSTDAWSHWEGCQYVHYKCAIIWLCEQLKVTLEERGGMIEKINMMTPALEELEKLLNAIYAGADNLRRDYETCEKKKNGIRNVAGIGFDSIKRHLEDCRQTGKEIHTFNLIEICDIGLETVNADITSDKVTP